MLHFYFQVKTEPRDIHSEETKDVLFLKCKWQDSQFLRVLNYDDDRVYTNIYFDETTFEKKIAQSDWNESQQAILKTFSHPKIFFENISTNTKR